MEKKKKSTLFTRLFGNRNKVTDLFVRREHVGVRIGA